MHRSRTNGRGECTRVNLIEKISRHFLTRHAFAHSHLLIDLLNWVSSDKWKEREGHCMV